MHTKRVFQKPRVRIVSVNGKINKPTTGKVFIMQRPQKIEVEAGGVPINRGNRAVNNGQYVQQQPQRPQQKNNGMRKSTVSIEEVPNPEYIDEINGQQQTAKFDEEKLPIFLIKLWNIVEDPSMQAIVHWDSSGASFHISDPYSLCRNILPHYFKHNNINSLIRQLNMYGFRKMTPLNQGGLTRTESDQDHLEFSHPYFVQNHPELMANIKRKQSGKIAEDKQVSVQTQHNMEVVLNEVKAMREKQRHMEQKMSTLTKENRQLWDQMATMRQQHTRQQHVVKKLFQFLVSMLQPSMPKRVTKRGVLAIDDLSSGSIPSTSKRPRTDGPGGQTGAGGVLNSSNLYEMLESLQRELQDGTNHRRLSSEGPLIADVTDELGNSPLGSSRASFANNDEQFTVDPMSSAPASAYTNDRANLSANNLNSPPANFNYQPPKPASPYMGPGALSFDHLVTKPKTTYPVQGQVGQQPLQPQLEYDGNARKQPKRSAYKGQYSPNSTVTTYQPYQQQLMYDPELLDERGPENMVGGGQLVQQQQQQQPAQNPMNRNLNQANYSDRSFSPTLLLSPSMERQMSQEMQDYLNGVDYSIDSCRDLLSNADWDAAFAEFDTPIQVQDTDYEKYGEGSSGGAQLALENAPTNDFDGFEMGNQQEENKDILEGAGVDFGLGQDNTFGNIPGLDPLDPLNPFPEASDLQTPGTSPTRNQ